jgi:hypothetical protein
MPAAMTFTSLQSGIRNYLARGGATDPIVYSSKLLVLPVRR